MFTRALASLRISSHVLRTGVIAGVALAAVAYPIAAVGGLALKAGAEKLDALPREMHITSPAQTTYVYAADGKTLVTMFYEEHRRYTSITKMSPYMRQAILAAEDNRFYEHGGVDPKGVARAFVANQQAGGVSQGASTLTMQYVRMALRDGARTPHEVLAATEQTSGRKVREMRLALLLEKKLNKDQILERYLNAAYFGHRAFGVFAASEVFFSKSPRDLTLVEAATLAGLVQAPSAYDPAAHNRKAAATRRNYVIDRMAALHFITPQQAAQSKKQPIVLKLTDPPNDCTSIPKSHNDWGFYCDFFKGWWLNNPAFGSNPADREDNLRRGGYRITLALDPTLQARTQRHVLNKQEARSKFAHGVVAVQPGTGRVRAMGVNRVYSLDQDGNGEHSDPGKRGEARGNYPNTVNKLLGGGDLPGYQAGSTFKMFTMLAALDRGMSLDTSFYAPYKYRSKYHTGWNDPKSCGGRWCPSNASKGMTGTQTMWSGFGKSVNTYFVQLEQKVGAERAVRMAEKLGLQWRTDIDQQQASPAKADTWGAFTLGVADTTPLEMANAYATIGAEGVYCKPLPVLSVKRTTGADLAKQGVKVAAPQCHRVFSQDVARAASDAASCVTGSGAQRGGCGGWSTAPEVRGIVGRPVAGKTGTTDNTRAAWFVGYTPQLAAASFIADPDNPFNNVGDWNSWKPIQTAAQTLRDGLAGARTVNFRPPSRDIVY
ncbi:transglycosylase domain-containing protein [Pilimelia terevasa]|uniref:transglycosylase domain-containing protein n=1 Tax=Pilimelia terevasa TaxID=53372 RepID=UPI001669DBCF|nr:transglycosylase domain-containing protein [Pilimelia terevasa]